MEIGTEISQKVKTAIKTKLVEFGSYVDDELPDYIMVMIANKRSQEQMIEDLNLFLGENSKTFCEWLHNLLLKLQEVTQGAFEVKVSLKRKSTETKPVAKTDENEALKISKLSRKPSPIRIASDADSKNEESSQDSTNEGKKSIGKRTKVEKHQRREEKDSSTVQSQITVPKRPTLPLSKQANPTLLKKAIEATQVSTDDGEYNPEIPSSSDVDTISDAEAKRRKREQLMQEHKKLQRLKSQQEEEEETIEPVLELQVAEDDDLFNTDESTGVKDRRIVVEKTPEREDKAETVKKEKSKKEKKSEKRKVEEKKDEPASESDDETKAKDKEKSVKTKGKRKKPKFIVTLEGVGSKFEDKYEKEHSKRKRRRKSAHRDDEEQEEINRDVPVMPVYPQFIHGVHQVPGMIPAHLSHPALPLQATQPIHMLPSQATLIAAPNIPVESTVQDVAGQMDFDEIDKSKEKCRFWPQCKNGDECPYYHPDVTCKHFPNCRYGQDCTYAHPPCKFGTRCTSTSCPYSHEVTTESAENETTVCRYHPFCTRSNCPFLHPVDKPCRYGKNCTRPGCIFKHHSVPPSREQLKWVAPVVGKVHVSDRKFAVNEANTTALPVQ